MCSHRNTSVCWFLLSSQHLQSSIPGLWSRLKNHFRKDWSLLSLSTAAQPCINNLNSSLFSCFYLQLNGPLIILLSRLKNACKKYFYFIVFSMKKTWTGYLCVHRIRTLSIYWCKKTLMIRTFQKLEEESLWTNIVYHIPLSFSLLNMEEKVPEIRMLWVTGPLSVS